MIGKLAVVVWVAAVGASSAFAQDEAPARSAASISEMEKFVGTTPPENRSDAETCAYFHRRGLANSSLGKYEAAVADLKKALSLSVPSTPLMANWCNKWRLHNDISGATQSLGDHFARLELLEAFSAEWKSVNPRFYFYLQLYQIDSYLALAMVREAQDAFDRATVVLPDLRQLPDWRVGQYNMMDLYSRYAAWLQELRANYPEAERLRRIAHQNAREYEAAVRKTFAPDSTDVRNATGNVMSTMRQLAGVLSNQGKLGEAEVLAKEVLRLSAERGGINSVGASNALFLMGGIRLQQANIPESTRYSELAVKSMEGASVRPYSRDLANKRGRLELLYAMQGRWHDVLKMAEERDRGLRASPQEFAKRGSASIDWAMAMIETGSSAKGVAMLRSMLQFNLKKTIHDPIFVAHLRGYLAYGLLVEGQMEQAREMFNLSIPILLEQTRDGADDENSNYYLTYRQRTILEAYLAFVARMTELPRHAREMDWASEAFRIAEQARNSSVQRALNSSAARSKIPNARLADLVRREQDLSNRLQSLNKLLSRLAAASDDGRADKIIAGMQRELTALASERDGLRKEIAAAFPDYANLVDPRPPRIADVQAVLSDAEALLSVYSGAKQAYVWTITQRAASFRVVPITRRDLDAQVGVIRKTVDLTQSVVHPFDTAASARIFGTLFAPDFERWRRVEHVNWIPHGPLGSIPLGLLLTATPGANTAPGSYADLPWLGKQMAIAQQASANGFVTLRKSEASRLVRKPFVGFGDPLFSQSKATGAQRGSLVRSLQKPAAEDAFLGKLERKQALPEVESKESFIARSFSLLPQLPDTAEELREIAAIAGADLGKDIFLGKNATEAQVKAASLGDYRVVAFATHGLVPGELSGMEQPALAMANPSLSNDSQNDGFLTMEEVLGLKLNADWVILSACNTASGEDGETEAVSGLGRAFFYAGTRSLLVSHWAVETVSARLLTTRLFQYQKNNPGLSRAEALRRSIVELMADTSSVHNSHPAFWAPFSLVGEGLKP